MSPNNQTAGYHGFWISDNVHPTIEYAPYQFDSSKEIIIEIEFELLIGCAEPSIEIFVCQHQYIPQFFTLVLHLKQCNSKQNTNTIYFGYSFY